MFCLYIEREGKRDKERKRERERKRTRDREIEIEIESDRETERDLCILNIIFLVNDFAAFQGFQYSC